MSKNTCIFEINTRVWLKRFNQTGKKTTLGDVPANYWDHLANLGIEYVWLMGVWELVEKAIPEFCLEDGLQNEYEKALPGWKEEDVIGSPYAINSYNLNPEVGTEDELRELRTVLHQKGLKLILDYIPNHFHAWSTLTTELPGIFIQASQNTHEQHRDKIFKSNGQFFANGTDPYFPSWKDTVQINYARPEARQFMKKTLVRLSGLCDGVRCDMAMLVLKDIFQHTWGWLLGEFNGNFTREFWSEAISEVKKTSPDFIFIAESYWDKEWYLQQLGFDYTYDKTMTDLLKSGNADQIKGHLKADTDFQQHSVRFLENHDEERAMNALGVEKACAAALIAGTIPGMKFYHEGQLEGRYTRLPVQLGREPEEQNCPCPIGSNISNDQQNFAPIICPCNFLFYHKLLAITQEDVFRLGNWQLLKVEASDPEDHSFHNILAWEWTLGEKIRWVVINYSQKMAEGKISLSAYPGRATLKDQLNDQKVEVRKTNILSLRLQAYKGRILVI